MARVPLYQSSVSYLEMKDSHGLGFYKFFDQWDDESWKLRKLTDEEDKQKRSVKEIWLTKFITDHNDQPQLEINKCLSEYCERQAELCNVLQGLTVTVKTAWRFVNGLGYDHPVDNGFTGHHTLGVPYIPASSVKGMVRGWALSWADESDGRAKHLEAVNRIFGTPTSVGSVIFCDAIPPEHVTLELDVMTPHTGDWQKDATVPPADWHNPVPIPFLCAAAGTEFNFQFLPTGRSTPDALKKTDLESVKTWLLEALKYAGIGAKTAVGYGRMQEVEAKQQELRELEERKQQELRKTPEEKLLERIQNTENRGLKFNELKNKQIIAKYLDEIKALPPEHHAALRQALEARVATHPDKKDIMQLIRKAFGEA